MAMDRDARREVKKTEEGKPLTPAERKKARSERIRTQLTEAARRLEEHHSRKGPHAPSARAATKAAVPKAAPGTYGLAAPAVVRGIATDHLAAHDLRAAATAARIRATQTNAAADHHAAAAAYGALANHPGTTNSDAYGAQRRQAKHLEAAKAATTPKEGTMGKASGAPTGWEHAPHKLLDSATAARSRAVRTNNAGDHHAAAAAYGALAKHPSMTESEAHSHARMQAKHLDAAKKAASNPKGRPVAPGTIRKGGISYIGRRGGGARAPSAAGGAQLSGHSQMHAAKAGNGATGWAIWRAKNKWRVK